MAWHGQGATENRKAGVGITPAGSSVCYTNMQLRYLVSMDVIDDIEPTMSSWPWQLLTIK
jgi:hypothetical protein